MRFKINNNKDKNYKDEDIAISLTLKTSNSIKQNVL